MQMKDHTEKDSAKTQEADPNIVPTPTVLRELNDAASSFQHSKDVRE
jgi:hypothetical protein